VWWGGGRWPVTEEKRRPAQVGCFRRGGGGGGGGVSQSTEQSTWRDGTTYEILRAPCNKRGCIRALIWYYVMCT